MDSLSRGGLVHWAAATQRFTEKLLANPNLALRSDSCWHILPTDLKQTHYDLREKLWGPQYTGDLNLTAQQPLLDGGEGKLIDSRLKDNGTETSHNTAGLKVGYLPYTVVRGTEGDPPLASSCVAGGGSQFPALVSKGAIEHLCLQADGNLGIYSVYSVNIPIIPIQGYPSTSYLLLVTQTPI